MESSPTERAIQLDLTREVTEALRSHAFDGLKALPRRGAEVGGLITGLAGDEWTGEDFRLVPCEHLFGPSYRLSTSDLLALRDAVAECQSAGRSVVAWFRSCTRPALEVDPEDQKTIADVLPAVPFIVMAKPAASGSARMCVFRRGTAGEWVGGEEFEVAPFFNQEAEAEASVEASEQAALVRHEMPADPIAMPVAGANAEDLWYGEERQPPPEPSGVPRWARYAAAGLLAVAGGGYLWVSVHPLNRAVRVPQASTPRSTLGLAVRDEHGMLLISWSRDSAAALSALEGKMTIVDGTSTSSVPLRTADITFGSLAYMPRSADVVFRLQLQGPRGESTEDMYRVIGNQFAASNRAAPLPEGRPPIAAKPEAKAETKAAVKPETPKKAVAVPFVPPPAGSPSPTVSRPSLLEEPVAVSGNTARPPATVPALVAEQLPTPAATLQPPAGSAPKPEQPQPTQLVVVTPPVPVHQVAPSNRGNELLGLSAPVTVGVLVSVDANGRVTGAQPDAVSRNKGASLLSSSLAAAREWTFKPATQSGQPVPGEHRIEFVFRPGADKPRRVQ